MTENEVIIDRDGVTSLTSPTSPLISPLIAFDVLTPALARYKDIRNYSYYEKLRIFSGKFLRIFFGNNQQTFVLLLKIERA